MAGHRLRDIVRALGEHNVVVEPATGGGSHFKAKRPGARTYVIPAHNGDKTELDDKYVKALCKNFEIDFDVFRAKL